ncbi:hypothetical protein TNCV_2150071 [Trichonephila clavipes]|nr:hypothetical protein TNCV_2150071 [Trichonephila clavipes]
MPGISRARAAALDIRATRSLSESEESHKQVSSDVPIKSNRGSINWEFKVVKRLVHHAQSSEPRTWHLVKCAYQC